MKNLEILLENALDAVVGANDQEKIIYWNTQAEKTFGWSKAEALGKDMADLIIPVVHRSSHRAGMKHYLNTGEGPILNMRIEVPALRRDGTEFPCELTVTPIKTEAETSFFSFIRDVTDRKRTELERAVHVKSLSAAVKVRDEFLAICSHELKTPLTSLLLQFDMLKRAVEKGDTHVLTPESTITRLDKFRTQLRRLVILIDDMLDVSRIEVGKLQLSPTYFNVYDLVCELANRFGSSEPEEQMEIICQQPREAVVFADIDRMEQVFTNLITNAFKYGGGKKIFIYIFPDVDQLKISVVDQGAGIATEMLGKIFEKFERADPNTNVRGLGLGLFITKSIVEAHTGTIEVESSLQRGSKFIVSLPRIKQ